jgi:hypothetical protein
MTISESINDVRLTRFQKTFREADEATQRDIRNGARMGFEAPLVFEPTGHPRPALDAEFNEE